MVNTLNIFLCLTLLTANILLVTSESALKKLKDNIKAGRVPIRGVNLGGWLVAEYWMTSASPAWKGVPASNASAGEYTAMKYLGHNPGDKQFNEHRKTFITEQDFQDIAANGMNTVRIPVGYWITGFDHYPGGDPNGWKVYAPGAINYLDRAIRDWAPKYNITVLVDLHAAKGSQNGDQDSSPENPGYSYWSEYPENVLNTLDAVKWLAQRYNNDVAFLGIGLLNEPGGTTDEGVLKKYYYNASALIRPFSDCLLTVSPLIDQQGPNEGDWNDFMRPPQYYNIRQEWHRYQIWGFDGWTADQLINYTQTQLKSDILAWPGNPLFIGEWALASSASFTNAQLSQYAQSQLTAFQSAVGGWTYWTWKFYDDDGSANGWSMKDMINLGFLQL